VLADLSAKKVMVGCLDLSDMNVESPETVVSRVKKALEYLEPGNVILAPDCGMKYLPRDVANGKLGAMVRAAKILREEYA
jgi:5-methyltetrahydropteroyltriglutamate--homocysteine methyltransferase